MNILIAKRLSFDQISINISDYEFCFDDKIQKEINAMRNKKVEESIQHWYEIWDWLNYYLQWYQEDDNRLHLDFGTVRFRNISMTKFLDKNLQDQIKDNQAKWLYVAWIIKTNDNQYIFPRRSGRDITKAISQEISTISWMLQPDDNKIINFDGVWHHMKVELEEELGVKEQYITHWEFIGLTTSKAWNRGIIFYIELNINYNEVVQFFNQNNDWEMSEVIGIPSYQLEEFLTKEWFDDQWNYTTKLWLYRDIMQQTHFL
jgi:hypothetical protein